MNKRQVRSSAYQWIIVETVYPTEMLEAFSNEDSVYKRLNPFDYNDEVLQLQEELTVEFWRIVETLTPRQRQVIKMCADGYTQMEIARVLGVNQSSITKSLNGNKCYDINKLDDNKRGNTVYGGCKKKLRKIIEQDEKIQDILRRIADLRDEEW